MKLNLIKKITALALSAILAFSATTVFATTDAETDFSQYIDYDADYTKDDINNLTWVVEPGSKYTAESYDRYYSTYVYAQEVYENPDATQEEINKAYIELYEAELLLEICDLDEDLINLCYDYCVYLNDNFIDYFTDESQSLLWDCQLSAQLAILYTNTQEGIDKATQETIEKLRTLELAEENPDIVLWTELEQINSYMDEYIAENSIENVDYVYNRIPRFIDHNGYRMVTYLWLMASPMINVKRYNGYILESNMYFYPSGLGHMLVNSTTGDIITIEEGIENGIVDLDKLFASSFEKPYNFNIHIIGDADCDNQLSISDATYIQKICATLETDSNTYEVGNFNDFNNDGKVNIVDATEIQKALVQ